MNNLKRVLSLALASVMLIGMMAVSASATSFSDDTDIENKAAVGTMTALNIINGYPNGSYQPKGLLTRAEAAKMVFVAVNGGRTNENLTTKAIPTFTDIKGNWAEGYIEWAANQGIIAGMGDGTFAPKGNLTGTQLAKIMLVAIGYEAKTEGLEGTNDWALNVNALALKKGFYDGLSDVDPETNITRDQAARLILNACNAEMVTYSATIAGGILVGSGKAVNRGVTLLTESYDAETQTGILTKVTANADETAYSFELNGAPAHVVGGAALLGEAAESYIELLGQRVNVLYKDNTAKDIYGIFPTSKVKTVTKNVNEVTVGANKNVADASGTGLSYIFVDGLVAAYTNFGVATSYDKVTLIDNDSNGVNDVAVVTTYAPGKVTFTNATETTVLAGTATTYKAARNTIAEGLKKDDYVVVVKNPIQKTSTTKYDVKQNTITKIDAVNATVTGVKKYSDLSAADQLTTPTTYEINGEWYNDNTLSTITFTAGADVTVYPVNGVIYYGAVNVAAANLDNVAMLVKYDGAGLTPQVRLLYINGTSVDTNLNLSASTTGGDAATRLDATPSNDYGKLFTVTEGTSGVTLRLFKSDVGEYTWDAAAVNDTVNEASNAKAGSNVVTDDAIVMIWSNESSNPAAKIYTGKQFKNINFSSNTGTVTATLTKKVDNLTRAGVVAVKMGAVALPTAASTSDKYAYVLSDSYTIANNYTTYDVWTVSGKATVTEKALVVRNEGDVIKYSEIKDGVISGTGDAGASTEAVYSISADSKVLYLGGTNDETFGASSNVYTISSSTVLLYIDTSVPEGKTEAVDLMLADAAVGGGYTPNVIFVKGDTTSGKTDLLLLIVDIKNKVN